MTAKQLREKRRAANVSGRDVCKLTGFGTAKLSDIEPEHITATVEDLRRIDDAIERILRTRKDLLKLANDAGLPLTGVRL